ncbi:MAG TPA: glycosyltransferase [Longimicrobiales bacterium]
MRVAYVTMLFPAPAEVFAANDVRALRALGDEVAVHCLRPETAGCRARLAEHGLADVPVTYATGRGALAGLLVAARHPRWALDLLRWVVACSWRRVSHLLRSLVLLPRALEIFDRLRADPPDVVHLFWGHYPALVGYLVARHCPGVTLSMFLGAYDLTWRYGGSGPVARLARVVWTHAEVNVPALRRLGVPAERLRVVHRGLDLRRIPARATEPVSGRRLITVGRLIPSKAFDDVLEVFARIHRRWNGASLLVIGDGPDRSRLRQAAQRLGIAGAVTFAGHRPHDEVLRALCESDVLLFLSRKDSERLPNVVKEGMACRCACVVSRTPGIEALVVDGETGFVVEPGDLSRAEACVDAVFRDPPRARAMAERAHGHVVRNFDAVAAMRAYRREWRALRAAEPALTAVTAASR